MTVWPCVSPRVPKRPTSTRPVAGPELILAASGICARDSAARDSGEEGL